MNNTTQRTDPRVLRTRQLLRDAVIELLEEMDIEKISVNRIAERAKINRVTFYLHYRDLPDMLEKMADEMVEDILQVVNNDDNHHQSVDEENLRILESLLKHIGENAKFYKVILTSKRSPIFTDRLFNLMAEIISAHQEKKEGTADHSKTPIQKDIAVWYGSAALIGTVISWLRDDMPYTPVYLARQISMLRAN
ncbi:TetR/AcrR family transcriptional regulator C-terminal domain-containing protein [Paenibacillus sp. FSL R7-0163]|uniref:TetR/AcrR family transcriptional regulator n=1 Tax=Paenibacillus TaxID=44249 RepID=UPI00096FE674|nr:TetR/AcrR family transcriptional regulator [Paenibacillus odorifer]OMD16638.1 TetR family transcriptional regulator [Paenibacillus odorifer]OMD20973.1 TetR family transcriptional regulator [Paenibacillus odorifer]